MARADEEGKWKFVGMLPLFDPPREQAKATIASAVEMGVSVKMVTGDQLAIARETAKQLGMGTNILDAGGLGDSKKDATPEQAKAIEDADGFAQVFPEHKFHIIQVLQKRGHFVGMTGDGVNDAPALKQADCGIAVSGATDAARAAASIVLLAPGLSVIIDAIKEARRIVQRMNSYAIYRIAETLRVLLFMTLSILIFNFYPVTAVMIVLIAVLNDGAILSIAYDNVHYKKTPEAWNMRLVLGIASVLGFVGPIAAFGLFYLGDRVFHLGHPQLQTLMYLLLSVAGHLTIFLTRTRGPFWSIRPARILWIAVLGTQTIATLIAVYGLFMTPIGWKLAGLVWGYAIVWALLTDRVRLLGYRFLDHVKADAAKPVTRVTLPKAEAKTDQPKSKAKAPAAPEAKAEVPKTEAKVEPEARAKAPSNLSSQIAGRAYELYEHRAPEGGTAALDWQKAEQELRKNGTDAQPKPEAKTDEAKPEAKLEPKPETETEPHPEAPDKPQLEATPQLVKRVHELYEELGREDVKAVQDWENTHPELEEHETHK